MRGRGGSERAGGGSGARPWHGGRRGALQCHRVALVKQQKPGRSLQRQKNGDPAPPFPFPVSTNLGGLCVLGADMRVAPAAGLLRIRHYWLRPGACTPGGLGRSPAVLRLPNSMCEVLSNVHDLRQAPPHTKCNAGRAYSAGPGWALDRALRSPASIPNLHGIQTSH